MSRSCRTWLAPPAEPTGAVRFSSRRSNELGLRKSPAGVRFLAQPGMISECREEDAMGVISQSPGGDFSAGGDPVGLQRVLGVPISPASLDRALTHRSYAYENGNLPTNERLEFL